VSSSLISDLQIFKPKGDLRWAFRFRLPDGTPGPRRPMGRGYTTKRDAKEAAERRFEEIMTDSDAATTLPSVFGLIGEYQRLRPGKGGGKERVLWALGKIEARFGETRIDKVTARDVELWIATLPTSSTRWEVSRVGRQLFAQATRHYGVTNPVTVTAQPRREEVKPFQSLEELEHVAIELDEWGDLVRFVAATGMRPEEWIPLEPGDVDEQAQTVTIRRTYTEGKGLDQFVGKTRGSIRTIPLSDAAMAAYRSQRRRRRDSPLVFPAPRGGYLNLRNWRHRDWQPALEAAGLEQRGPNALRHTFATWFLLHSDDRWLLAKLMGTGVDMIELHYGHLIAPHANRSRAILDAIWENYLDANWTQQRTSIPTASLENHQNRLNHAENSEAL
jgi:integrase